MVTAAGCGLIIAGGTLMIFNANVGNRSGVYWSLVGAVCGLALFLHGVLQWL